MRQDGISFRLFEDTETDIHISHKLFASVGERAESLLFDYFYGDVHCCNRDESPPCSATVLLKSSPLKLYYALPRLKSSTRHSSCTVRQVLQDKASSFWRASLAATSSKRIDTLVKRGTTSNDTMGSSSLSPTCEARSTMWLVFSTCVDVFLDVFSTRGDRVRRR